MAQSDTVKALEEHACLRGMSREHLEEIARCTQWTTVSAGQYLGREHETANALYLIQTGRVSIEIQTCDRGVVRLQTLGPGEIVGWSWLVAPHRWQFDAQTIDSAQLLVIDAEHLRWKCAHNSELGYELLRRLVTVIAGRLKATRQQLLERQV